MLNVFIAGGQGGRVKLMVLDSGILVLLLCQNEKVMWTSSPMRLQDARDILNASAHCALWAASRHTETPSHTSVSLYKIFATDSSELPETQVELVAASVIVDFYDANKSGLTTNPFWCLEAYQMIIEVHNGYSFIACKRSAIMHGYHSTWALHFPTQHSFDGFVSRYKEKLLQNMSSPASQGAPHGADASQLVNRVRAAAKQIRRADAAPSITPLQVTILTRSLRMYKAILGIIAASEIESLSLARGALVFQIESNILPHMHRLLEEINAIDLRCLLLEQMDAQESMLQGMLKEELKAEAEHLSQLRHLLAKLESMLPWEVLVQLRVQQGGGQVSALPQPSFKVAIINPGLNTCYSLMAQATGPDGMANSFKLVSRDIIVRHIGADVAEMRLYFQSIIAIDWNRMLGFTETMSRVNASLQLQRLANDFQQKKAMLAEIESSLSLVLLPML